MTIDDHLKEIKRLTEQYRRSYEEKAPKFNGEECKKGCNCAEIEEYLKNGQPIKSYPCLSTKNYNINTKLNDNNVKDFLTGKTKQQ